MRISDWSSDVCSSDLGPHIPDISDNLDNVGTTSYMSREGVIAMVAQARNADAGVRRLVASEVTEVLGRDRKSVVWGKSVSVRVDLGGRHIINNKNYATHQ